jgi:2-dehydro-3-deoxyphosphogalactonate aldolase
MTHADTFRAALGHLPLIAILRGLTPAEAPSVGDAIVESGFRLLEVPLNSPQPLESIALMRERFPGAMVGAGTVLTAQQVRDVHAAGGTLVVSPNFNAEVVAETVRLGMIALPGVATPSEAFAALAAGASGLKLFPAEAASPAVVKAWLAVLPGDTPLMPVGGITPSNMDDWRAAGATGFGIGSAIYKPAKTADAVREDALRFVAAWTGSVRA